MKKPEKVVASTEGGPGGRLGGAEGGTERNQADQMPLDIGR